MFYYAILKDVEQVTKGSSAWAPARCTAPSNGCWPTAWSRHRGWRRKTSVERVEGAW